MYPAAPINVKFFINYYLLLNSLYQSINLDTPDLIFQS